MRKVFLVLVLALVFVIGFEVWPASAQSSVHLQLDPTMTLTVLPWSNSHPGGGGLMFFDISPGTFDLWGAAFEPLVSVGYLGMIDSVDSTTSYCGAGFRITWK